MGKKTRRGGHSLAALGQAASNLLVPLGFFYGVKKLQSRKKRR